MFKAAVFLDRDGVINYNRPDYVKSWDEFRFINGALSALRGLANYNWKVIVITNQSIVGRQMITLEQLQIIHDHMVKVINHHGGRIDRLYVCPHHPKDGCLCRKPLPGLIYQAADDFNIDLGESIFIGDSKGDVEASRASGLQPVLVTSGLTPPGSLNNEWIGGDCWVTKNLATAVKKVKNAQALNLSPADYIRERLLVR